MCVPLHQGLAAATRVRTASSFDRGYQPGDVNGLRRATALNGLTSAERGYELVFNLTWDINGAM